MCGGSKGQTKTSQTSTTSATPEAMAAYRDILSRAQEVAATPYQAYEGERVAGFTPYQEQAFGQIAGAQGAGMGTLAEAGEAARRGAQAITAADIQRGMDPYQQQVIQTTMDEMARQNAIEQSRLQGQAISAGAFGGDRAGIAASELAKRQGETRAATMASLLSQGYNRAVAQAQADRQAAQVGTGQLMGVAQQEFGMPLSQAQALAGVGTAQQQLAQQQLNVPYQQYLEQRAYPFQQAQWLAGLSTGVGGAMGGTTTGQGTRQDPPPNIFNQLVGAGMTAAMMFPPSDERVKDNIVPVGKLNDGQTVYKYNYKGDPQTQIGLMAQEVEQTHPEAVGEIGGIKRVDYNAATQDAVPQKADGGGIDAPYIPSPMPMQPLQAPKIDLDLKPKEDESEKFVGQAMNLAAKMRALGGRTPKQDGGSMGMDGQAMMPYGQGFIPKALPMRPLQAPQINLDISGGRPDESQKFVGQAMEMAKTLRNRRKAEMPSAQSWASGTTITPEPEPEWGYMADGGRVPMQDGGVPVEELKVRPADEIFPDIPPEAMPINLSAPPQTPMDGILPQPPKPSEVSGFAGPAVQPSSGPATVKMPDKMALSEFVPGAEAPEKKELADVPGLGAAAYQPPPMAQPMGLGAKGVAPQAPETKGGFGFDLSPEARQAIMQAGFAMMASRSPYFGQAAGEAGMVGMQAYGEAKKLAEARKLQKEKLEQENWQILPDVRTELNQPILYNRKTGQAVNALTKEPLAKDTKLISDKGDRLGFLYEKLERDAARREAERKPTPYVTKDGMPVSRDAAGNLYDPTGKKLSEMQVARPTDLQAERKSAEKKETEFRKVSNIYNDARIQQFDINAEISDLLPKIDNVSVGYGRNTPLKDIKGSTARDVQEVLDHIKSQLQLGALQELKAMSSTGASGLGATTQNEIKMLGEQIANLSPNQSPEQLKKQLGKLQRRFVVLQSKLRTDLEENFGEAKNFKGSMERFDKAYDEYVKGEREAGRGMPKSDARAQAKAPTAPAKPETGAAPMPTDRSKLEAGKTYTLPNGTTATWTGTGFKPAAQ